MAKVKVSEPLPVPVDRAWALASDLSRLGEWLSLHEGWRGEVPAELAVGVELTGVVKAKGIRNRVTWVIDRFDPPRRISLTGKGKGGTSVSLELSVVEIGSRATFDFEAEFTHPALVGPMGSVLARTVTGDLRKSVARFADLA